MKSYKISEILYWIIALIASYESFLNWSINRKKAYIFIGFAFLSIFMALFRRHFRKKFKNEVKPLMVISDLIIIICLMLSAFFSGMEIAFVSSNKIYLEIEKQQSGINAKLLILLLKIHQDLLLLCSLGIIFHWWIYGILW